MTWSESRGGSRCCREALTVTRESHVVAGTQVSACKRRGRTGCGTCGSAGPGCSECGSREPGMGAVPWGVDTGRCLRVDGSGVGLGRGQRRQEGPGKQQRGKRGEERGRGWQVGRAPRGGRVTCRWGVRQDKDRDRSRDLVVHEDPACPWQGALLLGLSPTCVPLGFTCSYGLDLPRPP